MRGIKSMSPLAGRADQGNADNRRGLHRRGTRMLTAYHRLCHRYYLMRGATYHEAVVDDARIRYYRMGAGPNQMLLLHGLGDNAWTWRGVAARLAPHAELIIPHLPGFGESLLPKDQLLPFSAYRRIMGAFAQQLARGPMHVAGLSMGGWLSGQLALDRPELFESAVLVNPGGARTPDLEETAIRFRDFVSESQGARIIRQLAYKPPAYWHLVQRDIERVFRGPVVQHLMNSMREQDFLTAELIQALPARSTLILGEDDVFLPMGTGTYYRTNFPGKVVQMPRTGHLPPLERPRQLAQILAGHLLHQLEHPKSTVYS